MYLNEFTAISPIDGRYRNQTKVLSNYFSEFGLNKWRIYVEIKYFLKLIESGIIDCELDEILHMRINSISQNFSLDDQSTLKLLESTLNHDIKSIEYFLKDKISDLGLGDSKEFIHFGLTSQDINNTAIPLLTKKFVQNELTVELNKLIDDLEDLRENTKDITILARTHGQPASPTKLGKEIQVFIERLLRVKETIDIQKYWGKFGGATGNFNAHHVAYPNTDWKKFSDELLQSLGLNRLQSTTQIDHYDNLCQLFDSVKRINTILIDLCRDLWQYISMDYFKTLPKMGEVGSSAMPHKVNPIDFENAEGNLGMANCIFAHFSEKLPISRLQRDLSDSTVLRNVGVPFAHTLISINSIRKGLNKLAVNESKIKEDLDNNWQVVAEGIQTILRREKYPKPYESLKELTRGKDKLTKKDIWEFIDSLNVDEVTKIELKSLSPSNYSGIFKIN
jgi:adenylosuccinate lyase